jgi:ABC-2 type transport system permease protein
VNWRHFQAVVWLRWRLSVNRMRRGGTVNAVIQTLLTVVALVGALTASVVLSVALFLVGMFALRDQSPAIIMFVWDGLVAFFLFAWIIGVFAELQRSDPLSLDKFLHLPVSPTGVFLMNYLSSLVSLILIVFVPAMFALSLGLAFAKGPMMLLLLPLSAALVLMVTAATYQFQGWLAALMVNKRRRRTVLVFLTMGIILIAQLPNLINMVVFTQVPRGNTSMARMIAEQSELRDALSQGKITAGEFQQRIDESVREQKTRSDEADRQTLQHLEETARVVNLCLPPGWLPFGALTAAEGNALPALLAFVGMAGLGVVSLLRSHQTTVRLYTGGFNSGKRRSVAVALPVKQGKPATVGMLEWRLPWLSEQASAVALGGLRSLIRAPEAKMMLISPIILVLVFGGIAMAHSFEPPALVRPLMAFGGMSMILLTMVQLVGNQFGFDRGGFRVYVLSAAPRREVLLGKNAATAPLALGLGALLLVLVQAVYPMRFDYFLAAIPQALTMYLLFCLLANCLSIYAPTVIRSGSFKPTNPKGLALLLQFVFLFLFPWTLLPALAPLGVELGLEQLGWVTGWPICLALSVLECAAVCLVYQRVLTWEGQVLQAREQKILALVTPKAE